MSNDPLNNRFNIGSNKSGSGTLSGGLYKDGKTIVLEILNPFGIRESYVKMSPEVTSRLAQTLIGLMEDSGPPPVGDERPYSQDPVIDFTVKAVVAVQALRKSDPLGSDTTRLVEAMIAARFRQ